jgi:hypothetical protein
MAKPLKPAQETSKSAVTHRFSALKRIVFLVSIVIAMGCAFTLAAIEIWPAFGAQVANQTRDLVGPLAVARVETIVFQVQDTLKQWQYQFTGRQAEVPWEDDPGRVANTPTQTVTPWPIAASATPAEAPPQATPTPETSKQQPQAPLPTQTASPTPTPYVWQLAPLKAYGLLENEGVWQPYLYDQDGNLVAARTFLQPDPDRPYTVVAIVAFDLNRTQLHFVLGFNDPALPDGPRGDGLIPEADRQPGLLLAAFNGGFRAANGQYGAMANGIEALPPKDDMATVGIYSGGEVRIGAWGREINDTPDLVAWRQNCRLVLENGVISPRVYNDSITDWGASISNQIVTRRSSLGLDQDAKTLYYFAGPSLSMPVLADAMLNAGVHQGMLLDINHFWVHFTAIHVQDGKLVAEPLIPSDMIDQIDRYLGPSPADFFYITANKKNQ